jgi:hypothetical protein
MPVGYENIVGVYTFRYGKCMNKTVLKLMELA